MKSRQELEQIFDKVSQQFSFEDAHLELATDKRTDGIIEFAKTFFLPDEPLSQSIGLDYDSELEEMFRYLLRDNISVILVSDSTDEIIGTRVSSISTKEEVKDELSINNKKMKTLSEFLSQKDDELNAFDKFGVDVAVRFLMLAVDRRYRNKGIASKLMQAAMMFYSQIGLDPVVLKGEGTSNFSKAIYEKFGFETLHEFVYEDYKIEGEVVFKNTGIHKSSKVYAKKM